MDSAIVIVARAESTVAGSRFFDCAARKLNAETDGKIDQLGSTFDLAPPCAGCVVFYEMYCGFAIAGTLTSLVFGTPREGLA